MTSFGESRVQEALPKVDALPDAEWHLVGRLQANKARPAARVFTAIHSIDSTSLLERLDRVAAEEGRRVDAFLQVNITGESSKAGFAAETIEEPRQLNDLTRSILARRSVSVVGLMTIGPLVAHPEDARPAFARLRELRDRLESELGRPVPELSMGMSGDLEAAVAEGATVVRVGSAIFGLRPR